MDNKIPQDMCSISGNFFVIWGALAFLGLVSILGSSAWIFQWLFVDVTFEKWLLQEQAESNQNDPTKQNIFGALKESDVIITNNSTIKELYLEVEKFLKSVDF